MALPVKSTQLPVDAGLRPFRKPLCEVDSFRLYDLFVTGITMNRDEEHARSRVVEERG